MSEAQNIEIFYVPIGTLEEAKKIARQLLEKKLIACANIIPGVTSIYQWKGNIEEDSEFIVIFKTSKEKSLQCRSEIEKLHPYDTPCVLNLSSSSCNEPYQDWVLQQLAP